MKHRLFDGGTAAQEDDFDEEEDDEEFEQYVKENNIDESKLIEAKDLTAEGADLPPDADWSAKTNFTCRSCEKKCDSFHMAASHMKHIHPVENENEPEQELCPVCPKAFRKKDTLKIHVWRHVNRVIPETPKHKDAHLYSFGRGKPSWTEEREWLCKRCDKNIKGISGFVSHLDTMHPNQCGLVCPVCDKELPSKRRLKIHVILHSDKKSTCPVRKHFVTWFTWFSCVHCFHFQHCGKDFSEGYKLRRHLREVHESRKEHVCSTCGKCFARADKLFQHELVHVTKSDKPVEWVPISADLPEEEVSALKAMNPESSDESSDSSVEENESAPMEVDSFLSTELKEETGSILDNFWTSSWNDDGDDSTKENNYSDWTTNCSLTCYLCSKIVTGFKASVTHMKLAHKHKKGKKWKAYQCICCPKSFARKDHLKNHVRRHVFVRSSRPIPWAEKQVWYCKKCDNKSSYKGISKYLRHLDDIHPNENSLPCPECDKTCSSVKALKNHVDLHQDGSMVIKNEDDTSEDSGNAIKEEPMENFIADGDYARDADSGDESFEASDSDSESSDETSDDDDGFESDEDYRAPKKRGRGRPPGKKGRRG